MTSPLMGALGGALQGMQGAQAMQRGPAPAPERAPAGGMLGALGPAPAGGMLEALDPDSREKIELSQRMAGKPMFHQQAILEEALVNRQADGKPVGSTLKMLGLLRSQDPMQQAEVQRMINQGAQYGGV